MEENLLFVYGTLRPGAGTAQSGRLVAESWREGGAWTEGLLLSVADYPGLVAGPGWVTGELLRLRNASSSWPWLDAFEGEDFHRERAWVYRDNGDAALAWCYRYVGPRAELETIASGDSLAAS